MAANRAKLRQWREEKLGTQIAEAVLAEREACQKIATETAEEVELWKDEKDFESVGPIARAIEARIRARGNTPPPLPGEEKPAE